MTKRLFLALWPDAATRAQCAAIAKAIAKDGRLVHPENLHVTLVFLGAVQSETETRLLALADNLVFDPVSIVFTELDYWRKPGIVCLTGKPQNAAAENLVNQLNALAAALDIKTEDRPYRAHVTLIRKARKRPDLTFEPILWHSDAFCLVESRGGPEGTSYRPLQFWPASTPGNATLSLPPSDPD